MMAKVLSLEEIESIEIWLLGSTLRDKAFRDQLKRAAHTAREYHRMREALEKIAKDGINDCICQEYSREALKEGAE